MDLLSLEDLKNKLRTEKGVITKHCNKIDNTLAANVETNILVLRDVLETKLGLVTEINEWITRKTTDAAEAENIVLAFADYQLTIWEKIYKLSYALKAFQPPPPPVVPPPQPNVPPVQTVNVKLPKLDIKKFEGDFTEWKSF